MSKFGMGVLAVGALIFAFGAGAKFINGVDPDSPEGARRYSEMAKVALSIQEAFNPPNDDVAELAGCLKTLSPEQIEEYNQRIAEFDDAPFPLDDAGKLGQCQGVKLDR